MLGAAQFGYVFATRTPAAVRVRVHGAGTREYQVLHVIDFTSSRKRMSVVVRTPEGKKPRRPARPRQRPHPPAFAGAIKVLCKGADTVLWPRLAGGAGAQHAETTLAHLELFATEGLRTLVFAVADISEAAYEVRPEVPPPAARRPPTADLRVSLTFPGVGEHLPRSEHRHPGPRAKGGRGRRAHRGQPAAARRHRHRGPAAGLCSLSVADVYRYYLYL